MNVEFLRENAEKKVKFVGHGSGARCGSAVSNLFSLLNQGPG
jgi:hypothetical protein